jgi:caffeoyl-CoA O-methyltransferase
MHYFAPMDFIQHDIQAYAEQHTSGESPLLQELNRYTHTSMMKARMLSGHLQGRLISMVSRMLQPQYVLDIGTFTGYSALCLAEGIASDGVVYTIDNNEEVAEVAKQFIEKSDYRHQVSIEIGNALDVIMRLNDVVPYWDLIWIDAEKSEYAAYYAACIDKLRKGGIMMADNVLWSGKILDQRALEKDEDTRKLHEFNQMVMHDPRVANVLLPVRDGIMMIQKL